MIPMPTTRRAPTIVIKCYTPCKWPYKWVFPGGLFHPYKVPPRLRTGMAGWCRPRIALDTTKPCIAAPAHGFCFIWKISWSGGEHTVWSFNMIKGAFVPDSEHSSDPLVRMPQNHSRDILHIIYIYNPTSLWSFPWFSRWIIPVPDFHCRLLPSRPLSSDSDRYDWCCRGSPCSLPKVDQPTNWKTDQIGRSGKGIVASTPNINNVWYCWSFINPVNSPVELGSWSTIIYRILYIQTVVGLGISEPSTVVAGDSSPSWSRYRFG